MSRNRNGNVNNAARLAAVSSKNGAVKGTSSSMDEEPYKSRGAIRTIEFIRVILILWVIFHHIFVTYVNGDWKERILGPFMGRISRGLSMNNQAVPYALIAVSGFITHWTSRHIDFSAKTFSEKAAFVKRRVGRVFLAHLVACIASIVILWPSWVGKSLNSAYESKTVSEHLRRSLPALLGLQSWFSMVGSSFTFEHTLYPNFPAWTVSSLMFCWAVYPLYSRTLVWRKNLKKSALGIVAYSVVMFVLFTLYPGQESRNATRSGVFQGFFWFPPMTIPQFAVGIYYAEIAATLYNSKALQSRWLRVLMSIGGFLLLATYFIFNMYDTDITHFGVGFQYVCWFRLHLIMGSVFLAALGSEAMIFGQFPCYPIHALGEYSLHIYLWQANIARGFYYWFESDIQNWPVFFDIYQFSLSFFTTIAFAIAYVEIVEKRLLPGFRRKVDQITPADDKNRYLSSNINKLKGA